MINNIHLNMMGTISFNMKLKGMRKEQDFIVMPINEDTEKVYIQSDTRIGLLDPKNGQILMSKPHSSGAYFHHLNFDKLTLFRLDSQDFESLKDAISKTRNKKAGLSIVKSDNSGAKSIFDL